jgi:hypothetical protein
MGFTGKFKRIGLESVTKAAESQLVRAEADE